MHTPSFFSPLGCDGYIHGSCSLGGYFPYNVVHIQNIQWDFLRGWCVCVCCTYLQFCSFRAYSKTSSASVILDLPLDGPGKSSCGADRSSLGPLSTRSNTSFAYDAVCSDSRTPRAKWKGTLSLIVIRTKWKPNAESEENVASIDVGDSDTAPARKCWVDS